MIVKAEKEDLEFILKLQYLAYQSEAELCNNIEIPPLKQTLQEVNEEYEKGIILKTLNEKNEIVGSVRAYCEKETVFIGKLIVHPEWQKKGIGTKLLMEVEALYPNKRYELFTSTLSKTNLFLYERLGYKKFKQKVICSGLNIVFLEKNNFIV